MSLVLNGTTGISGTNALTGVTGVNSGQVGGRRNIVINGAMKVCQKPVSVTGLGSGSGYFSLDRYRIGTNAASAGRFTMAQVADGPAGFANCLKLTVTTADTSIAAGERLIITQRFEGQDVQQLKKGTASAEQVTVSFYVKGNAAALYVCELFDSDNLRSITQSFAVTTAWNRIELTFAADTSDPLNDDNGNSLEINFWLHGGSTFTGGTFAVNTWNDYTEANRYAVADRTSIFDATSRTFFLTGVQMEIGSTATDFEHRSFCEEYDLCKRYYYQSYDLGVAAGATVQAGSYMAHTYSTGNTFRYNIIFTPPMRAAPTMVFYNVEDGTAGEMGIEGAGGTNANALSVAFASPKRTLVYSTNVPAVGNYYFQYTASAEL